MILPIPVQRYQLLMLLKNKRRPSSSVTALVLWLLGFSATKLWDSATWESGTVEFHWKDPSHISRLVFEKGDWYLHLIQKVAVPWLKEACKNLDLNMKHLAGSY